MTFVLRNKGYTDSHRFYKVFRLSPKSAQSAGDGASQLDCIIPNYSPMNTFFQSKYPIYRIFVYRGRNGSSECQKKGGLMFQLPIFYVFCYTMKQLLLLIFWCLLFANAVDAQNCNFRATPIVTQPSCAGVADGVVRLNIENPLTVVLTYRWLKILDIPLPLPALLTNVATGLSVGDYQVIISNGLCADTLKVNLPEPKPLQVLDTALCGIGGVVNLADQIVGGNGTYKLNVTPILNSDYTCKDCDAAPVTVSQKLNVFDVEVFDQKGCQTKRQVSVEVLDSLKATTTVVDETCTANGAITVRAVGGSGRYQYALDNTTSNTPIQAQEATFKNLRGNTNYNIRVNDVKGCRTEKQERVRYNPKFTPATVAVQDASCYGSKDGIIKVSPTTTSNTISGYTLNNPDATMQREPVFNNLPPNTYTVYVREGADCYVGYPAKINEPDSLEFSVATTETNCPGSDDGVLSLQANGGNGGYQYSIDGTNFQPRNIFNNLEAGNYKVVVRDRKGCSAIDVATVDEPEAPNVGPKVTASCPDDSTGSIVIVESGKLLYGSYAFSLDSINFQRENLFDGLAPGIYTVFVRYPDGCVYKVTAIVPEVKAPAVFFRLQHASCPGADDGSVVVEVTANGETKKYSYSIDGENFIPRNAFKDLTAGDYNLYIRDSSDCIFTYPFTIQEPQAPTLTLLSQNTSCFGGKNGKIVVQTKNGQPPFTYALNGINFQTSHIFDGLGASSYVVVVRDNNGCLYSQEASVDQPNRIQAAFTIVNETCGAQNGVLVCTPSGGTVPYRYRWETGDTTSVLTGLYADKYEVSISDVNNCLTVANAEVKSQPGPLVIGDVTNAPCFGMPKGAIELSIIGGEKPFKFNWSNGLREQKIYNLTAGNYTVTVTDQNQCASVKLFNLYEPAPIALEAQIGPSNGLWFINLVCSGGAPPYIYQWSTGETTEDVFNLKPAAYSVTVTDQQGCSQNLKVTVGTNATHEPQWASAVRIFPNPTQNFLNIIIETTDQQESQIQLFDINGKLALPLQKMFENQATLNLSQLPKGVYLLRLQRAAGVLYRRVVVQ